MDIQKLHQRNEILEKHSRLHDQYNRLCSANHLMTQNEWQQLEDKKKSILLEIDKCKALEKTFDDEDTQSDINRFSLQMLTSEEVQQLLNCSWPTLKSYIEIGMLKPIKTGKSYMFVQDDIYDFQQTYKGKDISNYKKALIVYTDLNEG